MKNLKKLCFIMAMLVMASLQAEKSAIVIYIDSFVLHAGFAGDDAPKIVMPNAVSTKDDEVYVDFGTLAKSDSVSYPIQDGKVVDVAQCEKVLDHVFSKLKADPKEQAVLLAYPGDFTTESIDQVAKILFDKFEVPALHAVSNTILILYSNGKMDGLVVCMDDNGVFVNAVDYGSILATQKIPVTSQHIRDYLQKLLEKKGYQFAKNCSGMMEEIKNKYCYVALNFNAETKLAKNSSSLSKTYTLEDGQAIEVKEERFTAPEAFFQPKLLGIDAQGVHKVIQEVIGKCDSKFRKRLYRNIVIAGSESMYPGLRDRIEYEFYNANKKMKTKVSAPPERKYGTWIGGSIFASLSNFKSVPRKEYMDHGSFGDLQKKLEQK
ncbi:actin family protein [Candidatus Uabimicrobium amorphum]|uniref:Bacterial actin-related protein n=1 Tax=Uabimicrobium amorphum TaxID=2596890 RepID=A0A5S9IL03_UABAM|nr:actin family protein [Candidatus Uabimicrobium amorphum]BBM83386.1 bacterial actin-related protein [Candidatus Uabimicrobium amorphum]